MIQSVSVCVCFACVISMNQKKIDYAINIYKQTTYQHIVCHTAKIMQKTELIYKPLLHT